MHITMVATNFIMLRTKVVIYFMATALTMLASNNKEAEGKAAQWHVGGLKVKMKGMYRERKNSNCNVIIIKKEKQIHPEYALLID